MSLPKLTRPLLTRLNDTEFGVTRDCALSNWSRGLNRISRRLSSLWSRATRTVNPDFQKANVDSLAAFEKALTDIGMLAQSKQIPIVFVMDSRFQSPLISHENVEKLATHLKLKVLNLLPLYRDPRDTTTVTRSVSVQDEHNLVPEQPRNSPG